jgi:hypothetical protein
MTWPLVLVALVTLALGGVCLRVCHKSALRVERFTFDVQKPDRAPPAAPTPIAGKSDEGRTPPPTIPCASNDHIPKGCNFDTGYSWLPVRLTAL